jgi:hypothetical protein
MLNDKVYGKLHKMFKCVLRLRFADSVQVPKIVDML